jgi:hypothetical protein
MYSVQQLAEACIKKYGSLEGLRAKQVSPAIVPDDRDGCVMQMADRAPPTHTNPQDQERGGGGEGGGDAEERARAQGPAREGTCVDVRVWESCFSPPPESIPRPITQELLAALKLTGVKEINKTWAKDLLKLTEKDLKGKSCGSKPNPISDRYRCVGAGQFDVWGERERSLKTQEVNAHLL